MINRFVTTQFNPPVRSIVMDILSYVDHSSDWWQLDIRFNNYFGLGKEKQGMWRNGKPRRILIDRHDANNMSHGALHELKDAPEKIASIEWAFYDFSSGGRAATKRGVILKRPDGSP